jgi:hypothetical protein
MNNMHDKQVAEQLLALIAPGDETIAGWIRAGESILAVATLIELAAQNRKPIPDDLRVAVQALVDEDAFDADEDREVVEDLATIKDLAPFHV